MLRSLGCALCSSHIKHNICLVQEGLCVLHASKMLFAGQTCLQWLACPTNLS